MARTQTNWNILRLNEQPAASIPGAVPNVGQIYVKASDSLLYFKDDAGTEYDLTSGGSGDITIGTTVINSGGDGRILYDDNGVVGEDANFVWSDASNAAYLQIGSGTAPGAIRLLEGSGSGTNYGALTVPTTLGGNRTYTFPDANTTIPVATQTITFSGLTAARTYTFPDSAQTIAALGVAQTFTEDQTIESDNYITFGGTTTAFPWLGWNTTQTVDTLVLALGTTSRHLVICENGDTGFDFGHGQATNNSVFIHSSAQSTTQYIGFFHDGTNGVISTGTGYLNLVAAGSTSQVIVPNGASNNVPGLGFVGVTNTGLMYQAGNGVMAFLQAGTEFIRLSNGNSGVSGVHVLSQVAIGGALGGAQNVILNGGIAAGTLMLGINTIAGSQVDYVIRPGGGRGGTDTDTKGSEITIAGGIATGNAIGGSPRVQTSVPGASGSTAQTLGDRMRTLAKYTTLTDATATAFARVNVPSGTVAGGEILVTVEANDGTEYQARTLRAIWSAVNKAGTTTVTLSTPEEAVAVSSGTLTVTLTLVDSGSGNIDFKAEAASSLTETVLRANAQVFKNFGTGAISAQ